MDTTPLQGPAGLESPSAPDRVPAKTHRLRGYRGVRAVSVALFGAILPVLLLGLAGYGLSTLQRDFAPTRDEYISTLQSVQKAMNGSDDANAYAFASFLYAEHSNSAVVNSKERLKISIMQIGFAVISVGIMFILLGVNDGGVEGSVGRGDLKVDFKTASTGLVTFTVGALMASGAALLKNEYTTVGVPEYAVTSQNGDMRALFAAALEDCKQLPEKEIATCFVKSIEAQITTPNQDDKK